MTSNPRTPNRDQQPTKGVPTSRPPKHPRPDTGHTSSWPRRKSTNRLTNPRNTRHKTRFFSIATTSHQLVGPFLSTQISQPVFDSEGGGS